MPIITMSREYGSQGDAVATAVAQRLHLRIIDRNLINEAARQARTPEVALAEIDELGLLGVKVTPEAAERYRLIVAQMMAEAASQGNVLILGRGGQVELAAHPGVLHVRVVAEPAERQITIQRQEGISAAAAQNRIKALDAARASYLRRQYGVSWEAPYLYALTVNTTLVSVNVASDIIVHAALAVERENSATAAEK